MFLWVSIYLSEYVLPYVLGNYGPLQTPHVTPEMRGFIIILITFIISKCNLIHYLP